MGIFTALEEGTHGVRFECPPNLAVERDGESQGEAVDRAQGVAWYFFYFPRIHLDLSDESEPSLRRDVECHARYLLESMRRAERPPREPPFTAKAVRSPLISCERVVVDGSRALSVLHRMAYQPGLEIVMGHLLIPLEGGLYETRWITVAKYTGMRESVLLTRAMAGELENPTPSQPVARHVKDLPNGLSLNLIDAPADMATEDVEELMRTLDYDDARYDAQFPDHVLTIARRAGAWLRDEAGIRVTRPAITPATRTVELRKLRCTLIPPPRFVLDQCTKEAARFHRVSLAGNDGVQHLILEKGASSAGSFEQRLRDRAGAEFATWGISTVAETKIDAPAPLVAAVVVDGATDNDERRIIAASVNDSRSVGYALFVTTTQTQPPDSILAELARAAATVRPVARPWWQFW